VAYNGKSEQCCTLAAYTYIDIRHVYDAKCNTIFLAFFSASIAQFYNSSDTALVCFSPLLVYISRMPLSRGNVLTYVPQRNELVSQNTFHYFPRPRLTFHVKMVRLCIYKWTLFILWTLSKFNSFEY
jgi:hypothetical protein